MTTINFTDPEMSALNEALIALPYFKAAPLIKSINEQIARQQQAVHDAAADASDRASGATPAALPTH